MSISVRCSNIVRYDPQQGKYIPCGHEFAVKDEVAGRSVRCPKCGELVTVPAAPSKTATPASAAPPPLTKPPSLEKAPAAAAPGKTAPAIPSPRVEAKSQAPPAQFVEADYPEVLEDDDEFRLEVPIEKPPLVIPSVTNAPPLAAKPAPAAPAAPKERQAEERAPCPGCGQSLAVRSVICPSCGYHKGLQRRVDAFEEAEEEERAVGFDRWLRRQLVEGHDPEAVRNMLILGGVLAMTLGIVLFLMFGPLVVLLLFGAGVFAVGVWRGWWKFDPWSWLLFVNRVLQWRELCPPFPHRKVLDLRNMRLNDDELGQLQNLGEFEVLDLEGTPVTDLGLPSLYDYKNLQFLILRDTQVTPAGCEQLQQALPNAWIWR